MPGNDITFTYGGTYAEVEFTFSVDGVELETYTATCGSIDDGLPDENEYAISHFCPDDGILVLTLDADWEAYYDIDWNATGDIVDSGTLANQGPSVEDITFTYSGDYAEVNFSFSVDGTEFATYIADCGDLAEASEFSHLYHCSGTDITYEVTYNGFTEGDRDFDWAIVGGDGASGTVTLNPGKLVFVVGAQGFSENISLTISQGAHVIVTFNDTCSLPTITAEATCNSDYTGAIFTLTVTAGDSGTLSGATYTDIVVDSSITITDENNASVFEISESLVEGTYVYGDDEEILFADGSEGDASRMLTMTYETEQGVFESLSIGPCSRPDPGTVISGECFSVPETRTQQVDGREVTYTLNIYGIQFTIENTTEDFEGGIDGNFEIFDENGNFVDDGDAKISVPGTFSTVTFFPTNHINRGLQMVFTDELGNTTTSELYGPCEVNDPVTVITGECFSLPETRSTEVDGRTVTYTVEVYGIQFDIENTGSYLDGGIDASWEIFDESSTLVTDSSAAIDVPGSESIRQFFDNNNINRSLQMVLQDGLGRTITSELYGPCGETSLEFSGGCVEGGALIDISNTGDLDFAGTFQIVFDDQTSTTTESQSIPVGETIKLSVGSTEGGTISGGEFSYTFSNCKSPYNARSNVRHGETGFAVIDIANLRDESTGNRIRFQLFDKQRWSGSR